jgi:NAD(P)-dependent dehydrogenase (short-subunit alcohol dehydrogenase family)
MSIQEESMPVLAIVGAGPGMGFAIAETFGANGYKVGHVAISAWIGRQPGATTEAIKPLCWELHTRRDEIEKVLTPSGGEAGR